MFDPYRGTCRGVPEECRVQSAECRMQNGEQAQQTLLTTDGRQDTDEEKTGARSQESAVRRKSNVLNPKEIRKPESGLGGGWRLLCARGRVSECADA